MTAELEAAFPDVQITLIPGVKGIFDVHHDNDLIYSKYQTGRHAEPGEVVQQLRK